MEVYLRLMPAYCSKATECLPSCFCMECSLQSQQLNNNKIINHINRNKHHYVETGYQLKPQLKENNNVSSSNSESIQESDHIVCENVGKNDDEAQTSDTDSDTESHQLNSAEVFKRLNQLVSERKKNTYLQTIKHYHKKLLRRAIQWFQSYRIFSLLRKTVFFACENEWKSMNNQCYLYLLKRRRLCHKLCRDCNISYLQLWYNSKLSNKLFLLRQYYMKWRQRSRKRLNMQIRDTSQQCPTIDITTNSLASDNEIENNSFCSSDSNDSNRNSTRSAIVKSNSEQLIKYFHRWSYRAKNNKYVNDLVKWGKSHRDRSQARLSIRHWMKYCGRNQVYNAMASESYQIYQDIKLYKSFKILKIATASSRRTRSDATVSTAGCSDN